MRSLVDFEGEGLNLVGIFVADNLARLGGRDVFVLFAGRGLCRGLFDIISSLVRPGKAAARGQPLQCR